jgi:hypothetical protein
MYKHRSVHQFVILPLPVYKLTSIHIIFEYIKHTTVVPNYNTLGYNTKSTNMSMAPKSYEYTQKYLTMVLNTVHLVDPPPHLQHDNEAVLHHIYGGED